MVVSPHVFLWSARSAGKARACQVALVWMATSISIKLVPCIALLTLIHSSPIPLRLACLAASSASFPARPRHTVFSISIKVVASVALQALAVSSECGRRFAYFARCPCTSDTNQRLALQICCELIPIIAGCTLPCTGPVVGWHLTQQGFASKRYGLTRIAHVCTHVCTYMPACCKAKFRQRTHFLHDGPAPGIQGIGLQAPTSLKKVLAA